ncbi:MAG TPA: [protein-PII] uridylyltransferase [Mariprofundaceae bacterium]|nr:[protein-PII] uridylyltransferase [Mariprofundaceae bacterium]
MSDAVLQQGRERLSRLESEMLAMFRQGKGGAVLMRHMCRAVDALLKKLWRQCAGEASRGVDLLAVGGYGRGELAPLSDWDLWLLLPDDPSVAVKEDIQRFLYLLWDMKVKVGHATRTVDEAMDAIEADWDTATAVSEARLLAGRGACFDRLQQRCERFFRRQRKAFVKAKLAEFDVRREKMGGTAFLMEPDIKAGKGGLRDIQAVYWMAKVWYGVPNIAALVENDLLSGKEYRQLNRAQRFLWRCRAGLHLLSDHPGDRLDFEMQAQLAVEMGYRNMPSQPAVERFMKHYFRHAGRVARVSDLLVMHFREELHPRRFVRHRSIGDGFVLEGKWLDLEHPDVFIEDPMRLLRVFHAGQQAHRRLSSGALRQIREHAYLIDRRFRASREANGIFLSILRDSRNVGKAIREMNDTGVLGRFIPDFGRVEGLGQFNRYHAYTVDEHTVRAVREARRLHWDEPGNEQLRLVSEVSQKIKRPELLYLALLFHDIAKGRQGDHSEVGEGLARRFCRRLGLSQDATALVSWLVRQHLLMAYVSQRSDLSDPEVVRGFVRKVVDKEYLDYLLLLTVADIRAVGPNVWNDWKGALLCDLYYASERVLMGREFYGEGLKERVQIRLKSTRALADRSERSRLSTLFRQLPNRCVLYFPPRQLIHVGRLMAEAKGGAGMHVMTDEMRGESAILVLCRDRKGLFADLTTAIACGLASVVAAQAYALDDGRVLDVFYVHAPDGGPMHVQADIERLQERIYEAIPGDEAVRVRHRTGLPRFKVHMLMRRVPVRVRKLDFASSRQTAIEVAAADRPGLLAELAQAIAGEGFDIRGANVSTFGERVVDVFFLAHRDGTPLDDADVERMQACLSRVATLPEEVA